MENQNYKNHIRFYVPHHFVFYPALMIFTGLSTYCIFHPTVQSVIYLFITILFIMVGWLSFMLRQHYALNNQNRIVRLEMRFRYYVLTGKRLENLEDRLSFGQIAALRFASDDELPALTEKTSKENLKPDEIKKMITNWQADHMRV